MIIYENSQGTVQVISLEQENIALLSLGKICQYLRLTTPDQDEILRILEAEALHKHQQTHHESLAAQTLRLRVNLRAWAVGGKGASLWPMQPLINTPETPPALEDRTLAIRLPYGPFQSIRAVCHGPKNKKVNLRYRMDLPSGWLHIPMGQSPHSLTRHWLEIDYDVGYAGPIPAHLQAHLLNEIKEKFHASYHTTETAAPEKAAPRKRRRQL